LETAPQNKVGWTAGEKWTLKFPAGAGFLYDKTSVTATLLSDMI